MHCRMFSSVLGVCPLDASIVTIKNVSRHCEVFWEARNKIVVLVENQLI